MSYPSTIFRCDTTIYKTWYMYFSWVFMFRQSDNGFSIMMSLSTMSSDFWKFHCDPPTKNEDTRNRGMAASASPELTRGKKAQSHYC